MGHLIIALDDRVHQTLKEAASRPNRAIASIVEDSLVYRGIKTRTDARALVEAARANARRDHDEASAIELEETRQARCR